jgi:hypothetical protein
MERDGRQVQMGRGLGGLGVWLTIPIARDPAVLFFITNQTGRVGAGRGAVP